jgi:hypothetical protein
MMKDWYPDPYNTVVPLCSRSATCVQRIDEIDALDQRALPGGILVDHVENRYDQQQVEHLAQHLRHCYACQMAVENDRKLRDQQRHLLHTFFVSEGRDVPSTTATILAALNNDLPFDFQARSETPSYAEMSLIGDRDALFMIHRKTQRARKWGVTLVLAVAIVMILSSLHMFTQFGDFNTPQATSNIASVHYNKSITTAVPVTARASTALHTTNRWSAVILTRWSQDGKHLIVENYNPTSKKAVPLFSSLGDTSVDSVSHSGKNLIYHTYNSAQQQTQYSLLSGEQYDVSGHGLNAVWSTDDTTIFLATNAGIIWKVSVNAPNTPPTELLPAIHLDKLEFYSNHFLYYVRGKSLYRINVDDSHQEETPIVPDAASNVFLMDPISEDIYYVKDDGKQREMYKHQENTSSTHDLSLHIIGTPVGYTEESSGARSLMYINWNQVTGSFDIRKTSSAKPVYPNIVAGKVQSLCNVAAVSGSICANSLALSPSGTLLAVGRISGALDYQLLSVNLNKQESTPLPILSGKGPIQLIGWDKWLVN